MRMHCIPTEEDAVDDFVPISCFCSMVRDDRNTAAGNVKVDG